MTEIGRRAAILTGTTVFAISALVGIFLNGAMLTVAIKSVVAGIIFGFGGLLIGNLMEGYVLSAAKREVTRRAVEKELNEHMLNQENEEEEESKEDEE